MKDNLSFSEQLIYYNKMALEYSKKNLPTENLSTQNDNRLVDEEEPIKSIVKTEKKEDETKNNKTTIKKDKANIKQSSLKSLSYEDRILEQLGFSPPSKTNTNQEELANAVVTTPPTKIPESADEFVPRFPGVDRDSFDYPFDKPGKNDIYLQFNDDTDFNLYQQFLRQNPETGRFRARVFTGRGSVPLEGAVVTVSKIFGDSKFVFDKLKTDSSGLTPIIELPAPPKSLSQTPDTERLPYSLYNVEVEADGFNKITFRDVAIYDDKLATQQAFMTPTANRPQIRVTESQPSL